MMNYNARYIRFVHHEGEYGVLKVNYCKFVHPCPGGEIGRHATLRG